MYSIPVHCYPWIFEKKPIWISTISTLPLNCFLIITKTFFNLYCPYTICIVSFYSSTSTTTCFHWAGILGVHYWGKDRRTMEHLQKGLPPAVAGHQNLVWVEPHLTALSGSCTLMDKHSSGGPHGLAKWIRVDLRLWPSHRNRAQLKTCSGRSVVNGSCDSAMCGWDMVSAYPRCQ